MAGLNLIQEYSSDSEEESENHHETTFKKTE